MVYLFISCARINSDCSVRCCSLRSKLRGFFFSFYAKESKAGGPQGCETLRIPHFVDKWLTGGVEIVSLKRRPPLTTSKILDTHFC
jgi:hypothetical protein